MGSSVSVTRNFRVTIFGILSVWLLCLSPAQGVFKPALDAFDADFAANVVANIACRTYSETEHNLQDFAYGGSVVRSEEILNGDSNRVWEKRPFRGRLNGRDDTWGAVYANNNTVVFGFHGSYWLVDWLQDFQPKLIQAQPNYGFSGNIHSGFAQVIECLFDDFERACKEANGARSVAEAIKNRELVFTGHSLGGALAVLTAAKFTARYKKLLEANQVKVITFSSPRVGDLDFVKSIYAMIPEKPTNIINFVCGGDGVPRLPLSKGMSYSSLGMWVDVLALEQTWDKTKAGVHYIRQGGLDVRVHVLKRFYSFTSPFVNALVHGVAIGVVGKFLGETKKGAVVEGGTAMAVSLVLQGLPVAIEYMKIFHEVPSKQTVRKAWAAAQMFSHPLDGERLPKSSALYHERNPIAQLFYWLY